MKAVSRLIPVIYLSIFSVFSLYAEENLFPAEYFAMDIKQRDAKVQELLKKHPEKFKEILLLVLDSPDTVIKNVRLLVKTGKIKDGQIIKLIRFLIPVLEMGQKKISADSIVFIKDLLKTSFQSKDIKLKLSAADAASTLKYKEFIDDIAEICIDRSLRLDLKIQLLEDLKKLDEKKYAATVKRMNKGVKRDSPDYYETDNDLKQLEQTAVKKSLNLLIEQLNNETPVLRLMAIKELKKITGKTFGFNPIGTKIDRENAVVKWEKWLKKTQIH
jgi:hypothetical protein